MRMRLYLAATLAGVLLLGAPAPAQAVPAAPDMIVSVRKDRVGADLVSVVVSARVYPPELLRSQLEGLGTRLGHGGARGIGVHQESFRPGDPTATLLKGSCGVDGLIDRTTGRLAIAPIAQAFAGAPEPYTVRRLIVSFDGERPGAKTLQRYSSRNLAFVGRPIGSSIEYDVELRTQDPTLLIVNEGAGSSAKAPVPAKKGPDPLTVALFAVAVAAAGALVYCLLLLLGRRSVARS